jgi:hypothetical protein
MFVIGPSHFRHMPWKNGSGTTCELLRLPHPQRPDDFALRISIATVSQGGPFSHFPGIDRTLMLLEGEGMALQFGDGRRVTLADPLAPIDFLGEDSVDCTLLDGPLRDFNVMASRDAGQATTRVIHAPSGEPMTLDGATESWAYLVNGQWQSEGLAVTAGELLAVPAGAGVTLHAALPSTAIVVTYQPLPASNRVAAV